MWMGAPTYNGATPASGTRLMNKPRESHLIAKLKQLPPQRVAEVEDFIDFLRTRDRARALTLAATRAAAPAFARIWNNDADAAYDRL